MAAVDGGPAFPAHEYHSDGMTLRDWFAGQALVGMGTWMPDYHEDGEPNHAIKSLCNPEMLAARAGWAYAMADAMLAARDKEAS